MKNALYFLTFALPLITTNFANAAPGALISVQMKSSVGYLLDEVPNSSRGQVVADLLEKPQSFWSKRATSQVEAILYRLVYRGSFYNNLKGRLPLPPKELWSIKVGSPVLSNKDGHQYVSVDYTFSSVLVTSANSVPQAEPALAQVGGSWHEPFVLPIDPDLLFERTGYACMDEADFPPNSVDSENARIFFDHTCQPGKNICHVTAPYPAESCDAVLKNKVGRISTVVEFKRLAWSESMAKKFRLGDSSSKTAELEVLGKLLDNNRITYRYVSPNSCTVVEGCVGGSGWRRLLQFDASIANRGQAPIELGHISEHSQLVKKNMFEFSPCHGHYHFSHYGKFTYGKDGQELSSKRAFCLASTSRYSNNEETPLSHQYNCHNQGIEAGWGDDYIAGIECQWLDVTDIKAPYKADLGFTANPDQFLCEGQPILDSENNFTLIPTDFKTSKGDVQHRIACDFSPGWTKNNFDKRTVTLPERGSQITTNCPQEQVSPFRNCGFKEQKNLQTCTPGSTVKLKCSVPLKASATVVRLCEASSVLGVGVGCTKVDSLANFVIEGGSSTSLVAEFKCPSFRDAKEPGGKYSVYTSSLRSRDEQPSVVCTALP